MDGVIQTSAPATVRRRIPRAQREELMLDAAERVFGEHGFRGASMDEIAVHSGITKAMLYEYFESKEGLFQATIERVRSRLFAVIQDAVAQLPPGPARMSAFSRTYFDWLDANRGQGWMLYGGASEGVADEMRMRNAEAIAEILEAGGAGDVRERRRGMVLTQSLVGAGEQVGRWWLREPGVSKADVIRDFDVIAGAMIAAAGR